MNITHWSAVPVPRRLSRSRFNKWLADTHHSIPYKERLSLYGNPYCGAAVAHYGGSGSGVEAGNGKYRPCMKKAVERGKLCASHGGEPRQANPIPPHEREEVLEYMTRWHLEMAGVRVQGLSDEELADHRNRLAAPDRLPNWRLALIAKVMVEYRRRGYNATSQIGE